MYRTITLAAIALLLTIPAQAGPLENHATIEAGADRILELQNDDGSFPILGHSPSTPLNVQGAIPHGLLESFKVTGNLAYLGNETSGVNGARNYIVDHIEATNETLTSSGIFFMAEYGLLTLNGDDLDLAREHLERHAGAHDSPADFVDFLLELRGNMGLWDTARYIRAAHDLGNDELAAAMADQMVAQEVVDPFDENAAWNEYGLSGLLFGLGESDVFAHQEATDAAREALLSRQCDNGAFPLTLGSFDKCISAQSTSFAIMGLAFVGDVLSPEYAAACDFLVEDQNEDGSWDYSGIEYVQSSADALTGLATCQAPLRNGATSYADPAVGLL